MSFRKRGVAVEHQGHDLSETAVRRAALLTPTVAESLRGTRSSPFGSNATTSTGCPSLDGLFCDQIGQPLGTSLIIHEQGTTDHAGILMRLFAAQGVLHGHKIHVVGPDESWARHLPCEDTQDKPSKTSKIDNLNSGQMKIAWRYQASSHSRHDALSTSSNRSPVTNRSASANMNDVTPFCHDFDLTQNLQLPTKPQQILCYSIRAEARNGTHFHTILQRLSTSISSSPRQIHRVIIPRFLASDLYPASMAKPAHAVQFIHGLRGILRRYSAQVVVMISNSLDLRSRSSALMRWIETSVDGILELVSIHYLTSNLPSEATDTKANPKQDVFQGRVIIHKLPSVSDTGSGRSGMSILGENLGFAVGRKQFIIRPFSLPPSGSSQEEQERKTGKDGADEASLQKQFSF